MDVTISGPFFNDSARQGAVARALLDAQNEVADQAQADVHQNLDASIKRPTPYYETQIRRVFRGAAAVVTDLGVIYGAWLEGVGSRNRTTRFKGYFSFRRAAASTRGRVAELAGPHIARLVRSLGGGS